MLLFIGDEEGQETSLADQQYRGSHTEENIATAALVGVPVLDMLIPAAVPSEPIHEKDTGDEECRRHQHERLATFHQTEKATLVPDDGADDEHNSRKHPKASRDDRDHQLIRRAAVLTLDASHLLSPEAC